MSTCRHIVFYPIIYVFFPAEVLSYNTKKRNIQKKLTKNNSNMYILANIEKW